VRFEISREVGIPIAIGTESWAKGKVNFVPPEIAVKDDLTGIDNLAFGQVGVTDKIFDPDRDRLNAIFR